MSIHEENKKHKLAYLIAHNTFCKIYLGLFISCTHYVLKYLSNLNIKIDRLKLVSINFHVNTNLYLSLFIPWVTVCVLAVEWGTLII